MRDVSELVEQAKSALREIEREAGTLVEDDDVQVDERERRASVLEAAALEIEVRGWCQGQSEDDEGRVCMVGSIGKALGGSATYDAMAIWGARWREQWPEYRRPADHVLLPLADWNDVCPDRTAEEVTFVLRWRAQEIRDGR